MTTALLTLIAAAASLILAWMRRRDAAASDPETLRNQANADADAAIALRNAGADDVNRMVQRGLDRRLRPEGDGDSGRP